MGIVDGLLKSRGSGTLENIFCTALSRPGALRCCLNVGVIQAPEQVRVRQEFTKAKFNLPLEIAQRESLTYLKAINTNPPVRPFLRNFPFLVNNLCISVVSHNEQVSQSNPASTIKLAFIGVNGKLIFGGGEWIIGHYAEDGTWCPSYYSYEFEETYEEAKAKLPTQSP